MSIYDYAAMTGAVLWVVGGGLVAIALLAAVYWAAGLFSYFVFKRLRRAYHLASIGYWLDRLEKEGRRCFLPPEKDEP